MQRKTMWISAAVGATVVALSAVGYLWYFEWSKPAVEDLVAGATVDERFEDYVTESDPNKVVYEMDEGPAVVVNAFEDLPDTVKEDIDKQLSAIKLDSDESYEAARQVIDDLSYNTQKTIIYVYSNEIVCSDNSDDTDFTVGYSYLGAFSDQQVSSCRADGTTYTDLDQYKELIDKVANESYNNAYVYYSDQVYTPYTNNAFVIEHNDEVELDADGEMLDPNGEEIYQGEVINPGSDDLEEGAQQPTYQG